MKRNTILFGLLVVLVVVAYIVLQKPGEHSSSSEVLGTLVEIDSAAVDKILVKTPAYDLLLEKRGAEWFVQKPVACKADANAVTNAIHQAKTLEVKGTVSSNPEKHSVFMVDSAGALVKIFQKGVEKASFIVGKASSNYTDTYVRKTNSNDVVLGGGMFGYMFNRPLKEWRDKNLVNTPAETIKEVRFQYGDTTFVL